MFVLALISLLLKTSYSTGEDGTTSTSPLAPNQPVPLVTNPPATLYTNSTATPEPVESDLESELDNYVIVLPNGDVRPAYLGGGSSRWDSEPLDHIKFNTDRIIGGRHAKKSEVPYQVGIMHKDSGIHCGGALLSADTVLTAAHCFKSSKHENFLFLAGKSDLTQAEPGEALSLAKSILIYPAYTGKANPKEDLFDLAIVKLEVPFCFNNFIQPIRIATPGLTPAGEAQISGWGYIVKRKATDTEEDASKYSRQLKLTKMEVISKKDCNHKYSRNRGAKKYAAHESVFCAWAGSKSEDACQGDSGGPITCKDKDGTSYLCGVISTGIGCGLPNTPAFFVDLSLPKLNQWVLKKTGKLGQACNFTNKSEPPPDDESGSISHVKFQINVIAAIVGLNVMRLILLT